MPTKHTNKSNAFDVWRRFAELDTHALLAHLADAGIVSVLLIAPLFMGGRDERGALVYVMAVMATVVAYCASQALAPAKARRYWRRTAVDYLLLAGLLLMCLQLVPVDSSLLARLSPSIANYLPLWTGAGDDAARLAEWKHLTLTPQATRAGAAIYLAHALFFLLLVQRLQTRDDVMRCFQLLAVGCVGFAVLGLLQFLAGNGEFLWVYEHPYRNTHGVVKGPFINQNHFAHLLALGIGPCIWWLQHSLNSAGRGAPSTAGNRASARGHGKHEGRRRGGWSGSDFGSGRKMVDADWRLALLLMLGLAMVALAGLLTFSRGGAIALVVASAVAIGLYYWKSMLDLRYAATLAVSGALVVLALAVFGGDILSGEFASIQSGDIDQIDSQSIRRDLWAADLAVSSNFLLTGTGVGSHAEVYLLEFDRYSNHYYSHAESGYIQLLLECGLPGIALLLCGFCVGGYWAITAFRAADRPSQALAIAAIAGLTASLLHSLWDFVWYLPACMSWTIALAAVLCRLSQLAKQPAGAAAATATPRRQSRSASRTNRPAWAWSFATVVLMFGAFLLFRTLAPPAAAQVAWEQYLKYEQQWERQAEVTPEQTGEHLLKAIALLDKAVARDPRHGKAHLALASCCLQRFEIVQQTAENRLDLTQIRSAAMASRFDSRDQLDEWLSRAVGENRVYLYQAKYHALRAVSELPLTGEGYVFLADLAFLDGAGEEESNRLLSQALLVRPHEAAVCFAAGSHEALKGDLAQALQHWKKAFHRHPRYRSLIVDKLAPLISAPHFVEHLEPDVAATERLYKLYRQAGRQDDARLIGQRFLVQLEESTATAGREQAARAWAKAAAVHRDLEQSEQAVLALSKAVHATPDDFKLRRNFALELIRQNRYLQAEEQIDWCLARKPGDAQLKKLALQAKRGRWENSTGAAEGTSPAEQRR
ncbi:MAG: O-antigen ligase family protein [Pirellulales bacterium]